jgi:branched-chain amino acid transport system substrate-binding protein
MVNQESSPTGSFPEVREGAEAAAEYVNQELGGVGGRPIRIANCATSGAPEASQACANQVLEKKPVAVVGGVDFGSAQSLSVFERAAIPYVGGSPTMLTELTSTTSFMLTGGAAAEVLGEVSYVTDTLHAKKMAVLYVDLPGLLSDATTVVEDILRKKGVTDLKVLSERADAADFTPSLTAATAKGPDVVLVVFPAQACARIMQAATALGVKAKMFYLGTCADQSVFDAAGQGAEGSYFAGSYLPYSDTAQKDVATYRAKLRAYRPGRQPSLLSQTGFSVVMDLYQLMNEAGGPPTPASLTDRLRATNDHANFMAHAYTCNGQQVFLLASICNASVRVLQLRAGKLTDVVGDWVNGAPLAKLATG